MGVTSPDLGRRAREVRFNPMRSLSPQSLTSALDGFEAGYLRQAALIWEHIEERDDAVKIAVPKRRKSVSRQKWTINKLEESAQAEKDAEALTFFYNNLTCTVATDLNVRGGARKLFNLMMTAEFYQYAAFEIIWQPRKNAAGRQLLTAELRFVPLYFFENRTGRLRYTGPELATDGKDLEPNGWLIHTGDGLHRAIAICALFKKFSLQDWINFSEKFGIPGIHGETPAAKGTPEWDAFVAGLEQFANDFIVATSAGTKISLLEVSKTGDAPFAPMVERMDRRITALCRGADQTRRATGGTVTFEGLPVGTYAVAVACSSGFRLSATIDAATLSSVDVTKDATTNVTVVIEHTSRFVLFSDDGAGDARAIVLDTADVPVGARPLSRPQLRIREVDVFEDGAFRKAAMLISEAYDPE